MQISDVRAWQWAAVGIVLGLLYSGSLWLAGPWFDSTAMDTIGWSEFEHALLGQARHADPALARRFHDGQPLLRDVIVHPPFRGDTARGRVWVTGQLYSVMAQPKDPAKPVGGPMVYAERWTPFKYPTAVPYVSAKEGPEHGKTFPTFMAFLTAAQKDTVPPPPTAKSPPAKAAAFPSYRYAWQELPGALWTLPAVAGLLIVGTAAPLTVGVLQRMGLVPPPTLRVAKGRPAPKPVPATVVPADAGVRVILPPSAVKQPEPVGPSKQYGGEFYPVAKNTER